MTVHGGWIVYAYGDPQKTGIWKIYADRSEAIRLTKDTKKAVAEEAAGTS